MGSYALYNNTTGIENTAIGFNAGQANISGGFNIFFGSNAGKNSKGFYNTTVGQGALLNNTSGIDNVAVGEGALNVTTVGYQNTSLGTESYVDLANGHNNTLVGAYTRVSGNNSIAIGYGAFNNMNNVALFGNSTTTQTGGYNNWTNFISDRRLKTGVKENVKGLDFIMRLRPVTYHVDLRALYKLQGISAYGKNDSTMTAEMKAQIDESISGKEAIRMSGFIAQEVEKAAQESGYDFDGIKKPQHDKDNYGLAYATLVVPLVKAVQEQQVIVEQLKAENAKFKSQNEEQNARLQKLENLLLK